MLDVGYFSSLQRLRNVFFFNLDFLLHIVFFFVCLRGIPFFYSFFSLTIKAYVAAGSPFPPSALKYFFL